MDKAELVDYARQHVTLKERIAELTTLMNDVKKNLKTAIESFGEENDRGHLVVDLGNDVPGYSRAMNQKRVSQTLDMEVAEALLKERGIYDECTTTVTVLDEGKVMSALYKNQLTEEDIDAMFAYKVTWALIVE